MISSDQTPVHHENIKPFISILLFPWFFTRLKKKKKSCNKERAEHCLSFLEMELELQVTQTEEKLNSVKCLSSLEEWVQIFLGGDSIPVENTIKWSPQNTYHQDPPLLIKSTYAKQNKGNSLKQTGAELTITYRRSQCFAKPCFLSLRFSSLLDKTICLSFENLQDRRILNYSNWWKKWEFNYNCEAVRAKAMTGSLD